jgi:excisionase family DNA binding protein
MMPNKLSKTESHMKTVDEIAADLHVHRITIYRLLKAGKIPGFKVGRVWRFRANEVHDWIENPARRGNGPPDHNGNGTD